MTIPESWQKDAKNKKRNMQTKVCYVEYMLNIQYTYLFAAAYQTEPIAGSLRNC